jgi:hypothetical protein
MSRRGRLGFVAACLLAFGLIAALITFAALQAPELLIDDIRAFVRDLR